jgi:hypothetical protein
MRRTPAPPYGPSMPLPGAPSCGDVEAEVMLSINPEVTKRRRYGGLSGDLRLRWREASGPSRRRSSRRCFEPCLGVTERNGCWSGPLSIAGLTSGLPSHLGRALHRPRPGVFLMEPGGLDLRRMLRLVRSADGTERWPSGLRRTLGKRVCVKAYRGFESHSLRQHRDGWLIAPIFLYRSMT